MAQILLIVAVLAVVVLLAWWHAEAERKRLAELAAWCRGSGFDYDERKVRNPGHDYELFERGHSRYQRCTARRRVEQATPGLGAAELTLFEYHYAVTRSTGKSTHTDHYYYSCLLVDPGADLGRVALRREGLGDKLFQALGFDDIDLEDPEFSKRFVVQARERKNAYALLDGPMMQYLCALPPHGLEARGRELFACLAERGSPRSYDFLQRFALGFLAQLPRTLVNAERARQGLPPELEAGNAAASSRKQLARLTENSP